MFERRRVLGGRRAAEVRDRARNFRLGMLERSVPLQRLAVASAPVAPSAAAAAPAAAPFAIAVLLGARAMLRRNFGSGNGVSRLALVVAFMRNRMLSPRLVSDAAFTRLTPLAAAASAPAPPAAALAFPVFTRLAFGGLLFGFFAFARGFGFFDFLFDEIVDDVRLVFFG